MTLYIFMELIDRKSPGTAVRRCFIGSDGFSICLRISMTLEWFMFKEETLYRGAPSRHREVGRPPNTDFIVQSPLTPFLPLHISWPPSLDKHRV